MQSAGALAISGRIQDFNHSGRWEDCRTDQELRARINNDRDIKLTWKHRADGTHLPTGTAAIHLPHLVAQMLTIEIQEVDVIVNVVTVTAVAEAVEAVEVVRAKKVAVVSIGTTTKVRPVVSVVSLT